MELIIVLVVVGMLFGVAVPRMERLSPKYSLRAEARGIASKLEYVRSTAVFQQKTYGVRYYVGYNAYQLVFPPPAGDADLPYEDWETSSMTRLDAMVKIRGVVLADNSFHGSEASVDVLIDPLGISGSHVVILEDIDGRVLSVKFNALMGTVDFYAAEVGFARFVQ